MAYYFAKTINKNFDDSLIHVAEALQKEGFGILTEIDVKATMKKKLDVDFRNYKILGACSPQHAFKAISFEDKIGTMLPCNVIVQQIDDNTVEVAAIDPVASMMAIENVMLEDVAMEIQMKLKRVIDSL